MRVIKEKKFNGLNKDKKQLLKSLIGVASSKEVDFNQVRDEWKITHLIPKTYVI